MRKNKIPRCYNKYKDDRTCDVCYISAECYHEFKLLREIKSRADFGHSKNRCKFLGKWNSSIDGGFFNCEDPTKLRWDSEDKIHYKRWICKPDIDCFPDLLRKEKLRKLNQINEI